MNLARAIRQMATGLRRSAALILIFAALTLALRLGSLHRHAPLIDESPCATCAIAKAPTDAPNVEPIISIETVLADAPDWVRRVAIDLDIINPPESRGPPLIIRVF